MLSKHINYVKGCGHSQASLLALQQVFSKLPSFYLVVKPVRRHAIRLPAAKDFSDVFMSPHCPTSYRAAGKTAKYGRKHPVCQHCDPTKVTTLVY